MKLCCLTDYDHDNADNFAAALTLVTPFDPDPLTSIVPTTKSADYLDFSQSLPPSMVLSKIGEDVIVKTRHKKSSLIWVCPNIESVVLYPYHDPWYVAPIRHLSPYIMMMIFMIFNSF
jgi:hypothetical protein